MDDTVTRAGMPLARKLKIAMVVASLVVVAIVLFQNTEEVQTRILFMKVTMPRAVLLFITAALGFGAGLLMGLRRATKPADPPKAG